MLFPMEEAWTDTNDFILEENLLSINKPSENCKESKIDSEKSTLSSSESGESFGIKYWYGKTRSIGAFKFENCNGTIFCIGVTFMVFIKMWFEWHIALVHEEKSSFKWGTYKNQRHIAAFHDGMKQFKCEIGVLTTKL